MTGTDVPRVTRTRTGRALLGRTGGLASTRIASAVVQALTVVVVARALVPSEFAVFALVLGVLQLAQAVCDGGCTQCVSRYHAEPDRARAVFRAGRLLAVVAGVVATVTVVVVVVVVGDPALFVLIPLGPWIAAERQAEVSSMFLVAWQRTGVVVVALVGRRALVLAACLAVAGHPKHVLGAFAVASLVGAALAAIVVGRVAARRLASLEVKEGPAPVRSDLPTTARLLLPYWVAGVGLQLRQLDLTVLSLAVGVGPSAAYAPASRLIPPLRIVPTTYAQMLLGHLARERRSVRRVELWGPCVAAAVVFGLGAVLAGPLLPLVLGADYAAAVFPLQISLLALVPGTAASVLTAAVQAAGAPGAAATAAWTSALLTLALVALLGFFLGAPGAAVATGLGFLVQAVLLRRALPYPGGERP